MNQKEDDGQLKNQVQDIHDALIGTYDKPGALRIVEKMAKDMYDEPNGIVPRMNAMDRYKWWVLGAVATVSFLSPILISWFKAVIQHL